MPRPTNLNVSRGNTPSISDAAGDLARATGARARAGVTSTLTNATGLTARRTAAVNTVTQGTLPRSTVLGTVDGGAKAAKEATNDMMGHLGELTAEGVRQKMLAAQLKNMEELAGAVAGAIKNLGKGVSEMMR